MARISFTQGLKVAEQHELPVIKQIEAMGFTCINHVTTTENAKPKAARKYRDERNFPIPDAKFRDNETGKEFYVDIKTKRMGPVYYFKQQSWRHGNAALSGYRALSEADNISVIVVFEEPVVKGFTSSYGANTSPAIDIGGLLCVNVLEPWIGQDHEKIAYSKMLYYERDSLHPISDIRKVLGWQ